MQIDIIKAQLFITFQYQVAQFRIGRDKSSAYYTNFNQTSFFK